MYEAMAGWTVSEALAHELDLATSLAMSESLRPLFPSFAEAVTSLPDAWFVQGRALLQGLEGDVFFVLGRLATVVGCVRERDYAALTLPLREATAREVADAARAAASRIGVEVGAVEEPAEVLLVVSRGFAALAGRASHPGGEGDRRLRRECALAMAILRGGPAHARFWFWLDQLYHQVYAPWRAGRAAFLDAERERARSALGGMSGHGPPALDWITPRTPLRAVAPLGRAVAEGRLSVTFFVEPFGIWDVVVPVDDGVLGTFAQPDALFDALRRRAEDIAERLKALSDPTRLTMLRILRTGEVDNSEVAAYLDLSHPTVSVHGRVLREAGLAEARREGRHMLHRLDPDGVRRLLREVESFLGVRATMGDDGD